MFHSYGKPFKVAEKKYLGFKEYAQKLFERGASNTDNFCAGIKMVPPIVCKRREKALQEVLTSS